MGSKKRELIFKASDNVSRFEADSSALIKAIAAPTVLVRH